MQVHLKKFFKKTFTHYHHELSLEVHNAEWEEEQAQCLVKPKTPIASWFLNPSFSICKFETFSADQNWRKSLFLWIWDFLSWSEIEGKSFFFLPITCKSTLHETVCKTLLHYKQVGNLIKKSANQNDKKKAMFYIAQNSL